MRFLSSIVSFGALCALVPAQSNCSAGAAPATTLATMNPFAGTSLYGHPNYPNPVPPTFPGFSFVFDVQALGDIEFSIIDLDLYDDGNLVQVNSTTTVTSPNQVGATVPVTLYLLSNPTWLGTGAELTQASWVPLAVGTLTVANYHQDSQIVFNPPVVFPAGNWGALLQVPPTTTGPNPGPLHPMLNPNTTTQGVYIGPALTVQNLQFQRESWTQTLASPSHTQSIEFHYQAVTGYANSTSFGTGCGTPTPVLGLLQRPIVGTTFTFEASNLAPSASLNFWMMGFVPDPAGFNLTQLGLPGCSLYLLISSAIVVNITPATAGVSTVSLSLPNATSFSGLVLYAQAAPLIGGAVPFDLSNGLCVAFGMH